MSYILDALRKSEEERQKRRTKAAGSGFTFVKNTTPSKKKFAFSLILTSSMLLALIILGGGWWWSQKDLEETKVADREVQPAVSSDAAVIERDSEPAAAPAIQEMAPPAVDTSSSPAPPSQPIDEIPYLSDMSAEFQARIPKLIFSGHVYSPEPRLRMIMINDAVVREGDPIGAELSLDEITGNGVVVGYGQTRFRIQLF